MPCTSLSVLSDTLTRNLTHVKYAQRLAEDLVSPPPVSPESFNRRRQQQERHQNIYSSSTMEPFEKTYAMIKPDAVAAGKAEEICQLIEVHGFTVVSKQKLQLTPQRAEDFYAEHKGKSFFQTLVNFMSSGPIYALVLAKPNAIKEWRALMGPTNSLTARAEKPKSLRALYGTDGTKNATHGSDSPASAAREIRFFFPHLSQEADEEGVGQYMAGLQTVLVHGLTVLAKEKPCAQPVEALSFLGQWLLDNNPNKPRVVLPADS